MRRNDTLQNAKWPHGRSNLQLWIPPEPVRFQRVCVCVLVPEQTSQVHQMT